MVIEKYDVYVCVHKVWIMPAYTISKKFWNIRDLYEIQQGIQYRIFLDSTGEYTYLLLKLKPYHTFYLSSRHKW